MRLTWLHLAFSITLLNGISVNGERYAVVPRQNSSPSPSSSPAFTAPTSSATDSTNSQDTARSSNGGSSTPASASSSSSGNPSSTSQTVKTTLSTSTSGSTSSPASQTALVAPATPTANVTSSTPANGREIYVYTRRYPWRLRPYRHCQRRSSSVTYLTEDYTSTFSGRCNTTGDWRILHCIGNQDEMVTGQRCTLTSNVLTIL